MKKKNVAKVIFSDKTKRARGIKVSSYEVEMRRLKLEHDDEVSALQSRIRVLDGALRDALVAANERRHGDVIKILRRVVPQPVSSSTPDPTPPRSA